MLLEVGRMCVKKFGRDAGSLAVITKIDKGEVYIRTTKRPKERKCNPEHLEFLNSKVDVSSEEAVNKALGVVPKKTFEKEENTDKSKSKKSK